ncbi:UNVERIFIED_CONTAM: hypothetical protein HDU68_011032 [Siphonaria sp. JEL0065]|nr:hypothetical protein HDU68_011032 [Siphonaria sp. JEL0065]
MVNVGSLVFSGGLFVVACYGICGNMHVAYTPEIIYIGLVSIAAVVFLWKLVIPVALMRSEAVGRVTIVGRLTLVLSVAFVALGTVGVPLDRYLCEWAGENEILKAVTFLDVFFAGCLVGMQVLMVYVLFGCRRRVVKRKGGGVGGLAKEVASVAAAKKAGKLE